MWSSRLSEEPQKLVRFQHPPLLKFGNLRFQISDLKFQTCPVRLAGSGRWPLKPETPGSKPARDNGVKSQISRTKNQSDDVFQFGIWFLGFGALANGL